MYLSTFQALSKAVEGRDTQKNRSTTFSDVIYVFIDLKKSMDTHQDNGTPHLYRALRDKKQLFIGGAAFTKIPMGDKVIDRVTPMWCAFAGRLQEQAQALLYCSCKELVSTSRGNTCRCGALPWCLEGQQADFSSLRKLTTKERPSND